MNRPAVNCFPSLRLTAHPLDTDRDKYDMTLDANLRRTQSWSFALQYIEDFTDWRRPMTAIQQVLWDLWMDYIGHPDYVSGSTSVTAR
ncbi:hypothetical protein [Halovenus rubra]|nr:hypothetical protein [Halovenus rubra]